MQFYPAPPTPDLPLRLVSAMGRWELGFRHELFGFAFVLGLVADDGYTLYYPTGVDGVFWAQVTQTMIQLLERYPETISRDALRQAFPSYVYKPISRDRCWGALQQQLDGTILPSVVCPRCDRVSYRAEDIQERYCPGCRQYHDNMREILA